MARLAALIAGPNEGELFAIPQRISEEALTTVIMVKRHDIVKFGLRRWLMSRQSK